MRKHSMRTGWNAPFAYAENGDDISLAHVSGKIVMVNDPVRKDTVPEAGESRC